MVYLPFKVLNTGSGPEASYVRVLHDLSFINRPNTALKTISATKEVILSAGSVGSPHILLNSGIGPSSDLGSVGVKTIVDHPSVGANMSDHPYLVNVFNVNGTGTYDTFERNTTLQQQDIAIWQQTGKGLLTDIPASHIGFMRLPANDSIFKTVPDPSAGPTSGHHEFLIAVREFSLYSSSLLNIPRYSFNFSRMVFLLPRRLAPTWDLAPSSYLPLHVGSSSWPPATLLLYHSSTQRSWSLYLTRQ